MKPPKTVRPGRVVALHVEGRYRAEGPKNGGRRLSGWRVNIEDAMDDARAIGVGARVMSENGVLLAIFENVRKLEAFIDEVERAELEQTMDCPDDTFVAAGPRAGAGEPIQPGGI